MAGTPTSTCSKTTANCPGGPTNRSLVYCETDRKSTRLNSSHQIISYAVFCLKKKKKDLMAQPSLECQAGPPDTPLSATVLSTCAPLVNSPAPRASLPTRAQLELPPCVTLASR